MGIKKYILDAINHRPLEKVPIFYHGDLVVNENS